MPSAGVPPYARVAACGYEVNMGVAGRSYVHQKYIYKELSEVFPGQSGRPWRTYNESTMPLLIYHGQIATLVPLLWVALRASWEGSLLAARGHRLAFVACVSDERCDVGFCGIAARQIERYVSQARASAVDKLCSLVVA